MERYIETAGSATRALPLPLVIPIVLHHSDLGWTAATELSALFDAALATDPAVAPHVPRLSFLLDDISHVTDEALAARALGFVPALTLWALRDARRPDRLLASLATWSAAMSALLAAESGREALLTIFRYLTLVVPDAAHSSLRQALSSSAPDVEKMVMVSMAEAWIAEGEARGRAEGARAVLRHQLEARFGPLSESERARLEAAGEQQLARWSVLVLSAESLQAVLAQ